jgi:ATP-dependent Lon protease
MGTLASVLQLRSCRTAPWCWWKAPRAGVLRYVDNPDYFEPVERVAEPTGSKDERRWRARRSPSSSYVKLNKKISPEVLGTIGQIETIQARRYDRVPPRHQDRRQAEIQRSPRSRSG